VASPYNDDDIKISSGFKYGENRSVERLTHVQGLRRRYSVRDVVLLSEPIEDQLCVAIPAAAGIIRQRLYDAIGVLRNERDFG
jgi:hypothetical protein